jgi:prepilin-type N-terminal cleavage/methylation domain-containing protein
MIKKIRLFDRGGFTLVEILVVISIIVVLFGVVVTSSAAVQREARDGQRQTDLRKIQGALQQYYTDHGFYPSSVSYVALGIPVDRSMILDNLSVLQTGITHCSGVAGACDATKIYLRNIPLEPASVNNITFNHYCYQSWTNSSLASNCDNSSSASSCQYFRVYAALERPTGVSYNCDDSTGPHTYPNYFVGP